MPIYEYTCTGCEGRFEELIRSATDEAQLRCPHCAGSEIQREMSVFAMQSTGSRPSVGPSCASCSRTSCSTCR